jgi:hypothetical protein
VSSVEKSVTTFLNVDLDLRAQSGLEELLAHLQPAAFVLHQTAEFACVEASKEHWSLEQAVVDLVEIIQSLPPQAKAIWSRCESRTFNIGIQAGSEPHQAYFALSGNAVSLLASVQADITITVYRPPD